MDTSKPKNWNPSPQPWVRNCLKRSFWNFGPKPMSTMTESWITMNSSKWWRSIDWTTQLHYLSWSEFKTCLWYQRIGSSIVTLCIQHRKSTKIKYYRDSNKVAYLSYHHPFILFLFFKALLLDNLPEFLVIWMTLFVLPVLFLFIFSSN